MINAAIANCVAKRGESFRPFCVCWVNHWVGLWTVDDRDTFLRTAVSTPHMQQMEAVAARDCGGS
jgi:hypothetical protein